MKPGATTCPAPSTIVPAEAPVRSPIAAISFPLMPTSFCSRGLPVPSMTSPPLIIMSKYKTGSSLGRIFGFCLLLLAMLLCVWQRYTQLADYSAVCLTSVLFPIRVFDAFSC